MAESARYQLAAKVHADVNAYPYQTDQQTWGKDEYWERISTAGVGDCEDYALETRARLMAAGVPSEDLRIGIVQHPQGGEHAVLVIKDGNADWVSDQTQPNLMTADQMKGLGYKAEKLQHPGQWAWDEWKL